MNKLLLLLGLVSSLVISDVKANYVGQHTKHHSHENHAKHVDKNHYNKHHATSIDKVSNTCASDTFPLYSILITDANTGQLHSTYVTVDAKVAEDAYNRFPAMRNLKTTIYLQTTCAVKGKILSPNTVNPLYSLPTSSSLPTSGVLRTNSGAHRSRVW